MPDTITGGCLCGGVRYAAPTPTLFCAHCHCRWCRAAHGAAFVTWFGVPESVLSLRSGGDLVRWYQSSVQSRRGFCSRCGTTLLYASSLSPGEMHVALATTDGPIDRRPQGHVFFDHRVDWIELGDALPRHDSASPMLRKYGEVNARRSE